MCLISRIQFWVTELNHILTLERFVQVTHVNYVYQTLTDPCMMLLEVVVIIGKFCIYLFTLSHPYRIVLINPLFFIHRLSTTRSLLLITRQVCGVIKVIERFA